MRKPPKMPMMGGMYQGPQSFGDVLSLIGAGLKDASPISQGGNLSAAQQMLMQRQAFQRQQQMLAGLPGLFGSQAPGQSDGAPAAPVMTDPGSGPTMKGPGEDGNPIGPAQTPPTYALPQLAPSAASGPNLSALPAAAAIYKAMGVDIGSPADYLKLGQPDVAYDRCFGF